MGRMQEQNTAANIIRFPASAIVRSANKAKSPRGKELSADHPLNALPFLRLRSSKEGGGIHYWDVQSSGSYGADCELGRQLGKLYLQHVGEFPTNGNQCLLGWIVADMVASGDKARGIIIGFMGEINNYAMCAAHAFSKKGVL